MHPIVPAPCNALGIRLPPLVSAPAGHKPGSLRCHGNREPRCSTALNVVLPSRNGARKLQILQRILGKVNQRVGRLSMSFLA